MKLCQQCGQSVAEEITTCPSCGSEIGEGRQYIDDYRIEEVLHEGHDSILCRAVKKGDNKPVMIRLFTPQYAVDEALAQRLKRELEALKKLPTEGFVSHQEIKRSSDGLWYRISEWIDAESWGDVIRSGLFEDYRFAFDLFSKIATILDVLHQKGHFIPHLILNDIMLTKDGKGEWDIKIDYKFSRFLDPKLDRPGPMLKRLLTCHPDIINQRPLDFRSDIWSLGKIFIELLTADYETCDFLDKVDDLPLPPKAEVLFKTMLADDPGLRPHSMKEVAETLDGIAYEDIKEAKRQQLELSLTSVTAIRRIKRRQALLAALIVFLFLVGGLTWFQIQRGKRVNTAILEKYANQYARSIAFVLVEYWLQEGERIVYSNRTEGTAFLVDTNGYLLTNRHVACPWLEDGTLYSVIQQLRQNDRSPAFGYRMFLWFEGKKAFNRSAGFTGSRELTDSYFLGSAYRTDGTPRLTIAGVARPPAQIRQLITSPLKDDFAVLKIDQPPEGLRPLPLDLNLDPQRIPKLSRVITLGFPLGSRSQASTVNVSVTGGNVRRSFENLLQIDASFYGGDSGGPIIDTRGKVIGIASGVATERAHGLMPVVTPLWSMAMVLPITKVAIFLQEVRVGKAKWNGVLDLSVDAKLKRILETATQGRWAEAMTMADKELMLSADPSLVMAAGMMHFCAEDNPGAHRLFDQSLSMDTDNNLARFMLCIIDWLKGLPSADANRHKLITLDWRSPAEFFGYLFRVLEGSIDEKSALKGWNTEAEKSWLHYVVGNLREKSGAWAEAEQLLRTAVLAAESDAWEFFLARAMLDQVQKKRLDALQGNAQWEQYQADIESFNQTIQSDQANKESRRVKLAALNNRLKDPSAGPKDKRHILENIYQSTPENGDVLVGLAFYSAMEEAWQQALEYAQIFLKREGRQSASRLSVGLLEAELLRLLDQQDDALEKLKAYVRVMRDPWYRAVAESLLGKRSDESLKQEAGTNPETFLVLSTAWGLWAEGSGDKEKAIEYYKEALESLVDDRLEFEFSKERIKSLRRHMAE